MLHNACKIIFCKLIERKLSIMKRLLLTAIYTIYEEFLFLRLNDGLSDYYKIDYFVPLLQVLLLDVVQVNVKYIFD